MKDQRKWAEGMAIADRLHHLRESLVETREFSSTLQRNVGEEFEANDQLPWLRNHGLEEAIERLDALLDDMRFDVRLPPLEEGTFWSLGSIDIHGEPRAIHAGFVETVLRLSITKPLSERIVAFLLQIPGYKDFLEREHHDRFGWHYHYLDHKQRRSNIILCWDTLAVSTGAQALRPLFCEKHAEGTKDFPGRPDLWGHTKRQSMHGACSPDLGKWPLSAFKMPGQKAVAVWPLNAVLAAAPIVTPVAAPRFPSKKLGRR